MLDGLLISIGSLLLVGVGVRWFLNRRRENRGLRCWECGCDLSHAPRPAGARHPRRCPECGADVESDDPDDVDEPDYDTDDDDDDR